VADRLYRRSSSLSSATEAHPGRIQLHIRQATASQRWILLDVITPYRALDVIASDSRPRPRRASRQPPAHRAGGPGSSPQHERCPKTPGQRVVGESGLPNASPPTAHPVTPQVGVPVSRSFWEGPHCASPERFRTHGYSACAWSHRDRDGSRVADLRRRRVDSQETRSASGCGRRASPTT
jgi:hypothetical protein